MRLDKALPTAFDRLPRIKGTTQIQTIVGDRTPQHRLCLCNYFFVELDAFFFCTLILIGWVRDGEKRLIVQNGKIDLKSTNGLWKLILTPELNCVFHFECFKEKEKLFSIGKYNLPRTWVYHIIKEKEMSQRKWKFARSECIVRRRCVRNHKWSNKKY